MLAQRKFETVEFETIRPKKRQKLTMTEVLLRHRMGSLLGLAVVTIAITSTYVGAYSRFMEKGYCKQELLTSLSSLKKENQKLRLTVDECRQAEKIEAFASANGMKPSQQTAYLGPTAHPHLAMNVGRTDIR